MPPITDDTDYRKLAAQAGTLLLQANRRDDRRTACEKSVIEKYANAK